MSFDKRFYGIYQGLVVDNQDPEGRGRVTVQVPQVTGQAVTDWVDVCNTGGGIYTSKPVYGSFFDTTTQTLSAANTPKTITLNTTDESNGVTIGSPTSRIVFNYAGTYNVQFSAQVANNGTATANFWLRKNGTNLTWTNGLVTTSNQNHHVLPAWNYVLTLSANDYLEFVWMSNDAANTLEATAATTSPAAPAIASMIVTATPVGNISPNPGDAVWIMYIAGDPNFPVWMGVLK
jgi:hypothetical protein